MSSHQEQAMVPAVAPQQSQGDPGNGKYIQHYLATGYTLPYPIFYLLHEDVLPNPKGRLRFYYYIPIKQHNNTIVLFPSFSSIAVEEGMVDFFASLPTAPLPTAPLPTAPLPTAPLPTAPLATVSILALVDGIARYLGENGGGIAMLKSLGQLFQAIKTLNYMVGVQSAIHSTLARIGDSITLDGEYVTLIGLVFEPLERYQYSYILGEGEDSLSWRRYKPWEVERTDAPWVSSLS
ncbi:hypothetical protein EJ04DRAFT_528549 [Polyplosphaeria fusca]|uniref:Uncharacterized protein n=1 Tax=Polyplosphaeria fusca TaxID=682080 RepID=A0A9P4UXV9_9PLEO|nr:hypothetical protein EJ04DRAFT_528549 [Polyplosphaeria fusca]